MRAKRLLGIKNIDVYALALYVDPEVKGALGPKFRGAAPGELAKSQRLFDGGRWGERFRETGQQQVSWAGQERGDVGQGERAAGLVAAASHRETSEPSFPTNDAHYVSCNSWRTQQCAEAPQSAAVQRSLSAA